MGFWDALRMITTGNTNQGLCVRERPAVKTRNTALHQVFQTPELCELILLAVDDITTVLHACRVNQGFSAVIQGSVRLQRMLWFQPDATHRTLTPGIYSYQPFISINTFFLRYFTDEPRATPPFMALYPGKAEDGADKVAVSCNMNVFKLPKGSWRDMLIAEGSTASTDVPLVCFCYDGASYGQEPAIVKLPFRPDMTAGALIDDLQTRLRNWRQAIFLHETDRLGGVDWSA